MKRWPRNIAYFWETAPFFRILLPFIAGILVYDAVPQHAISGTVSLAVCAVALLIFLLFVYTRKGTNAPVLPFVLIHTAVFFLGYGISWHNDVRNDTTWFGKEKNNYYLARITDEPAEKENSWKIPVTMVNSMGPGKITTVTGKAFIYLYKNGNALTLHKGDSILLPGNWLPIKNAGNPFEFDYARYCQRNNILLQQFCDADEVKLYAAGDPLKQSVTERAHKLCMQQLEQYVADPKARGLIQAMLLGDEVNLDNELRQSYAETGIIHIIAISGGNIAIFFIAISFVLMWLKNKKHLWIKYAIALPLVWFYVVMAGSSPSAVRAAVMFSLLALTVIFEKNNNSLNQLFATAFLLLCAQPMWLFSLGFQLSFVAVLSLILFYIPIYKWLSPANIVSRLVWSTVAASIAAEILVAPLVIYYFHTLPLLFILANVAAYLFMGAVLMLGIATITFSFIPFIASVIGTVLVWLVTVFDKIVVWLQSCNPVSLHFLTLSGPQLMLVYVIAACFSVFLLRKHKPSLFAALSFCCVLTFLFCIDDWKAARQYRLVAYNVKKTNHVELINGETYNVVYTGAASDKKTTYAVNPAHTYWQSYTRDSAALGEIFRINGKSILVLNKHVVSGQFPVDYLVVTGHYTGLQQLQSIFSPSVIILGNNYSSAQSEKMASSLKNSGVSVHTIGKEGAFISD